jgi:hypothetical protein
VYERRHVGTVCTVTREILRCRGNPVSEQGPGIRPNVEVLGPHLRKSEGVIVLRSAGTTEPDGREGPLL